MSKIDFSKLSTFLRNIVLEQKKVYCIVFILVIFAYSCLWLSIANTAKSNVKDLIKISSEKFKVSKFSYQSIGVSGYPLSVKVNINHPILTLDLYKAMKPLIKDHEDFYKFSWSEKITIGDQLTLTTKPFASDFILSVQGPLKHNSQVNERNFNTIIRHKDISANLNLSSSFFEKVFTPLYSLERLVQRNPKVNIHAIGLKSTDAKNNDFFYYLEKFNLILNFTHDSKALNKLTITTKMGIKDSKYGIAYSQYLDALHDIPSISKLFNSNMFYPGFIDKLSYLKGSQNSNLDLVISSSISGLKNGNINLTTDLFTYEKHDELISYNLNGNLKAHKTNDSGELSLKANIKSSANEKWSDYIKKSLTYTNKKHSKHALSFKSYVAQSSITHPDVQDNSGFLPIDKKYLHFLIPNLHELGQVELSIDLNASRSALIKSTVINKLLIKTNKFSTEFSGDIKTNTDQNYYGIGTLKLVNFKVLIDRIFNVAQEVNKAIKPNDVNNIKTFDDDKALALKLLKSFADPTKSNDENITIIVKNQKNQLEPMIGQYSFSEAVSLSNKLLKPIFTSLNINNYSLTKNTSTNTPPIPQISDCYHAGITKNWSEVASFCKKATKSGDLQAQYYYAKMYLNIGHNLDDQHKAFLLFKNIARLKYVPSYPYLAKLYESGVGTNKDLVLAKKWYLLTYYKNPSYLNAINLGIFFNRDKSSTYDSIKSSAWYLVAYHYGDTQSLDRVKQTILATTKNLKESREHFISSKDLAQEIITNSNQ